MVRTIVFDVNETLLDLAALDPLFVSIFGDASARAEWFGQMLQSAFLATITNAYTDFGTIGGAALGAVADRRGVDLTDEHRVQLGAGIRSLPPHADVRNALERLRDEGFRMATLTNSTPAAAEAQIANAGLGDFFAGILSADTVKRLKPAPDPYHHAAQTLGLAIGDLRLVAAHGWDIAGALRAGCAAAFVARPGRSFDPLALVPDIIGSDMGEVVSQIIDTDRP